MGWGCSGQKKEPVRLNRKAIFPPSGFLGEAEEEEAGGAVGGSTTPTQEEGRSSQALGEAERVGFSLPPPFFLLIGTHEGEEEGMLGPAEKMCPLPTNLGEAC